MKKTLLIFGLITFLFSCEEEKSNKAEIIDFSIISTSNSEIIVEEVMINSEKNKIYIFINNDLTEYESEISFTIDLNLSSGAKSSLSIQNDLTFNNPDEVKKIDIEAEDGTIKEWYLFIVHKQIQNSDFNNWFTNVGMNGLDYSEIGNSAIESVWATANMGTSLYTNYGTQPIYENSKTFVKLTTLSPSVSVPLAASTLFTGKFDVNIAIANPIDPKKATILGTPFIFKPKSFRIKYAYQASYPYMQVTFDSPTNIFGGNTIEEIEGEDKCAMYVVLGIINGNDITEIGRAELFSSSTDGVIDQYVDFIYTSSVKPTHIAVVFTSSKEGDVWKGSIGSELIVQEFELIYE